MFISFLQLKHMIGFTHNVKWFFNHIYRLSKRKFSMARRNATKTPLKHRFKISIFQLSPCCSLISHFNLYGLPVIRTNESCDRTAPHYSTSSGSFRPKTISDRDSSRSAQIKFVMGLRQTAFSGNNFDFGTSIKDKRTVSEYHSQNYCQRVLHSKRLRRSVKI